MSDMARGQRLRELREGMGLNQTAFADLANSSKRAQIRYEQGDAPDADYMAALAAAGLDVLYILTGQRSGSAAPAPVLSEGDRILLDNFHAAPAQVQAGIKTTLGAFAPAPGLARKRPPAKKREV